MKFLHKKIILHSNLGTPIKKYVIIGLVMAWGGCCNQFFLGTVLDENEYIFLPVWFHPGDTFRGTVSSLA